MWFIARYLPVSLISLKLSTATSTGGKSLLLPTPFALKMALLTVIIQQEGIDQGRALWPAVRDAQIAVRGPQRITVNNTFTKIMKPRRLEKGQSLLDPDTGLMPPMNQTIAFREYVSWQGDLQIALQPAGQFEQAWARWLTLISYIGKRGGFIQAMTIPEIADTLDSNFVEITQTAGGDFLFYGTMQLMDDCGEQLSFEQVDIYTTAKMRIGTDRILRPIVLPYRMERSSRSYTQYQWIQA